MEVTDFEDPLPVEMLSDDFFRSFFVTDRLLLWPFLLDGFLTADELTCFFVNDRPRFGALRFLGLLGLRGCSGELGIDSAGRLWALSMVVNELLRPTFFGALAVNKVNDDGLLGE